MSFKLYQINDELEQLLNEIQTIAESNDGFIPDAYGVLLDNLQIAKEKKVLDIARYIKDLKGKAEIIKNEIDNLNKRHKHYKNYSESLKRYLQMNLTAGQKYEDANTKISWRKSEKVDVFDMESLPDEFWQIERSPMLSIIKTALKKGDVKGARLIERNNVQIK